jgi:hypothetical protein
MSFLPLYLFLTLLSKSLFQEAIEDIHFVLIHSRHGARAPIQLDLNNTDIFGNKWEGQSELTETGVKQQYLIGLRNSIVYKNLYNPDYKNKEILVYSTNLNRTIMSAQAQLLGMYNNVHYNFESKNIKNVSQIDINNFDFDYDYFHYYPVPIHTYEEKKINGVTKMILVMDYLWPRRCKKNLDKINKNIKNETLTKKKVDDMINKYFTDQQKESTKKNNIQRNFNLVHRFCDVIISTYYDGKKIERIDLDQARNDCENFEFWKQVEIEQSNNAKDSGIYTMSLMMDNLLYWMEGRIKQKNLDEKAGFPKIVLYMGHDTTLIAMQRFLKDALQKNISNTFSKTPFASSQFFELRKNDKGIYNVLIFYDDVKVYEQPFSVFNNSVRKILIPQLNVISYCEGMSYDEKIFVFLLCLFVFLVVVCCALVYLFINKMKKVDEKNISNNILNQNSNNIT